MRPAFHASNVPWPAQCTQWDSGTGRFSSTITSRSCGLISRIQAPSSSTLATVAEREMMRVVEGRKMRLSSQTVPRSRSSR